MRFRASSTSTDLQTSSHSQTPGPSRQRFCLLAACTQPPATKTAAANSKACTALEPAPKPEPEPSTSPLPCNITLMQARGAAQAMEQVGHLSLAARDQIVVPLKGAMPALPDDGAHIVELHAAAAKLSKRLLTLSVLSDIIARDLARPAVERTTVLPDLAGDSGLLASTAMQTERLATDLLLLYHAAFKVEETVAGVQLPLAVSISSRLLHYSQVIRFSTD